jgi:diaminohydroxyphosphoribosylaminopyrimidine deaminase/5-amino-6-(5-phosphoribosylamino)uracil reductase
VVIGIETALADDPELTVREPRYKGRQPARVVFDSHCRLPVSSKLVQSAREIPTYLISTSALPAALQAAGVRGWRLDAGLNGHPDPADALGFLDGDDIESVLVEGGGQVAASFLRAGLVNRIEWFRAPIVLGSEGRPCLGALEIGRLAAAPRFRRVGVETLGSDLWERYERA